MTCTHCNGETKKFGKDRKGNQRFRCLSCNKTFIAQVEKPLGKMTLSMDKALMCMRLLVEGNSIRSIERITGVEKSTILSLLETVGQKCETLLDRLIQGVSVKDVQLDELVGFVGMKQRTAKRLGKQNEAVGDAWCFVAIEQTSKLILAWHLGRRTMRDTFTFTEKLGRATAGNFQVNTDGMPAYRDAVIESLGTRVDFAQIVKVFGKPEGEEHRYASPEVIEMIKTSVLGRPNLAKATTSHIERQNLTIRMGMRRMTRLTNGFSKKFENLRYAYALHFAYYNFCRIHSTLRCTPAMEAGVTKSVWSLKDLLTAV
jgi:transposase-like protein/IS1 family transposase